MTGILTVRHRVYVEEKNWLPAHPHGLEIDQWDVFSHHFLAEDADGNIVGTARMIEDSPLGFPFEESVELTYEDRESLYEVSRIAVLPEARGNNSLILVGLCRAIWQTSNTMGKKDWCAIVDEPVAKVLSRLRFPFSYRGPLHFYMGSSCIPLICGMRESQKVLFSPTINSLLERHIEEVYTPK